MSQNTDSKNKLKQWLSTVAIIIVALGGLAVWLLDSRGPDWTVRQNNVEKTDPSLVKYVEQESIATGFDSPRGIALSPSGKLYVSGDSSIRQFSLDGKQLSETKVDGTPGALSATDDGMLLAAFGDHIEAITAEGHKVVWPSFGKNADITSVSTERDHVWVADAGQRVIYDCDFLGHIRKVFGKKDDAKHVPGIITPSPHLDVAVSSDGQVWATNPGRHTLDAYAEDGSINKSWGTASFKIDGFAGCCNPTDFAIMPDGSFITSEKGLPRVKIYNKNGKFSCVVAPTEAFAKDVVGLDLAVDSRGIIYVLDPMTKTVRVFVRK